MGESGLWLLTRILFLTILGSATPTTSSCSFVERKWSPRRRGRWAEVAWEVVRWLARVAVSPCSRGTTVLQRRQGREVVTMVAGEELDTMCQVRGLTPGTSSQGYPRLTLAYSS